MQRRTLLISLAGLISACAGPSSSPAPPSPTAASAPTSNPTPAPIIVPPPTLVPTTVPTAPPATATPTPRMALDVRLWNGTAEVQLDGRTIEPGRQVIEPGVHHLAALVDGDVVYATDSPADGGTVDLIVPPPFAGLAVMVENQSDARPPSGLPGADGVYQALAHGVITPLVAGLVTGTRA